MTEITDTRGDGLGRIRSRPAGSRFWSTLPKRIAQKQIIPVISNSFGMDPIFRPLIPDLSDVNIDPTSDPSDTVEGFLASHWAAELCYPLIDRTDINRVAQYNRTFCGGQWAANNSYLDFIKKTLLDLTEAADPVKKDHCDELRGSLESGEWTFSEMVRELSSLDPSAGCISPLEILAELPLPIYVTTSYHEFLERELERKGKHPCTQICMWTGNITSIKDNHALREELKPTENNPLVYHLYGLEDYPTTMVLSEDDHLDFFESMILDTDSLHLVLPGFLQSVLKTSSLVLLGYRMQEWDFRILFRLLLNIKKDDVSQESLIIQLTPGQQITNDAAAAQEYLEQYFNPHNFRMEWNDSSQFLRQVWDIYDRVLRR